MADLHVGSGQTYATIASALSASSAGDNIIIHAGTYVEGWLNVTEENITITNYESDAVTVAPSSAAVVFDLEADGITVENLTLELHTYYGFRIYQNDATIDNCTIAGTSGSSLRGVVCTSGKSGLTVSNCSFTLETAGSANYALYFTGNTAWTVSDCTVTGWTSAMYLAEPSSGSAFENTFTRNLVKACTNRCLYLGGSYNGLNGHTYITNNVFDDNATYVVQTGSSGYDNWGTFVDNTCLTSSAWRLLLVYKYLKAVDNNIFVGSLAEAIRGDGGGDQPAPDENIFYDCSSQSAYHTAPTNSILTDPELTDYVPASSSPAVDAGSPQDATVDYLGNVRPQGEAWDIGAVELVQSASGSYFNRKKYVILPSNSFYSMEPILEGEEDAETAPDTEQKGWVDLALNSNYIDREVGKSYLLQDLQTETTPTYIQITPAVPTCLGVWTVQKFMDTGLLSRIRYRTSGGDVAGQISVTNFDTGVTTDFALADFTSATWADQETELELSSDMQSGGPFLVVLYCAESDVGAALQIRKFELHTLADSGDQLPGGVSISGHVSQAETSWNEDSPLTVDDVNSLIENSQYFHIEKRSSFLNWCDDLTGSTPMLEIDTVSSSWQRVLAPMNIKHLPGIDTINYCITGFSDQAGDKIRIYTKTQLDKGEDIPTMSFPSNQAGFDPTDENQWLTGTIEVKNSQAHMPNELVYIEVLCNTVRGASIMGIGLHE